MSGQSLWKPIPNRPGLEVAVYDNLAKMEAYKSFLPKEEQENIDKVVTSKDPIDNKEMTYKLKFDDRLSIFTVLRWEAKAKGVSKFSPTISVGCELVTVEEANAKLKVNKDPNNTIYAKITGNPMVIRENVLVQGASEPYPQDVVKVLIEWIIKKTPQAQEEQKKAVVAKPNTAPSPTSEGIPTDLTS